MRLPGAALIGLLLATPGCAAPAADAPPADPAFRLELVVRAVHPHDPTAFTQGLVWHGGRLFESTGQFGASSLREVEIPTGRVVRSVMLPREEFGEGLALVGERLVQLTWQNERARIWRLADFAPAGEHRYRGEGWGLTFDGRSLVQSDGSSQLTFRSPADFSVERRLQVLRGDRAQFYLNELEWAEGALWANIWLADEIVRIDPATGRVTAWADASSLLAPEERRGADVLNGIAFDARRKVFYLTGKYWPKLFEVELREPRP